MKKRIRNNDEEKYTFIDILKGVELFGIPLWILLFFLCCVGIMSVRTGILQKPLQFRRIDWKKLISHVLQASPETEPNVPFSPFRARVKT